MNFKESIAEMKRHSETRLEQEAYLNKLNNIVKTIKSNVEPNALKNWDSVEFIIHSSAKFSDIDEEHIRNLLKGD
jgi:hypothetical protein